MMTSSGWVSRMALAALAGLVGVGLALVSATAGGAAPAPAPGVGPGIAPLGPGVVSPQWSVSATLHPSETVSGTKTSPPPTPN